MLVYKHVRSQHATPHCHLLLYIPILFINIGLENILCVGGGIHLSSHSQASKIQSACMCNQRIETREAWECAIHQLVYMALYMFPETSVWETTVWGTPYSSAKMKLPIALLPHS